jgi:hypothetical protein
MVPGATLGIYQQGKVIKDPDTGLPLDVQMIKTGKVKIDTVQEKLSLCSLVEGKMPKVGDTLQLEQ